MFYFLSILTLYIFTLHPTISPYRDSGDLVAAAFTSGVAHPPGYPLFVILGKIFILIIPFGNVAYRVNVMSAVCGAMACLLLYMALRSEQKAADVESRAPDVFRMAICLLPTLALALTVPFWRLSQVSEMYSLNAFFASLIVYLLIRLDKFENFYVAAFLLGLACGNHLTIIFLAPSVIYYLIKHKNFTISPSRHLIISLLFLLGFSVHLFMPVRAAADAVINWGGTDTLKGFLRTITRADYGGLKLHPAESEFSWSFSSVVAQMVFYFKLMTSRFSVIGILLGAIGISSGLKNRLTVFSLISFLVSGPLFALLSNLPIDKPTTPGILEPHFVLPDLFFSVLIYSGLKYLFSLRYTSSVGRHILFGFLAVVYPAALFVEGFKKCDYRNDFYAYDYGRNLLNTLPKGSILYDPDDPTAFITDYFNIVLGKRRDVIKAVYFRTRWGYERLKKRHPEILPPGKISSGVELARTIIDFNRNSREIYTELPSKFPLGYRSFPSGLLYRMSESFDASRSRPLDFYSLRADGYDPSVKDFFTNQIISYYTSAYINTGLAFFYAGEYRKSQEHYYAALNFSDNLPPAWNNLGTLSYQMKDYASAVFFFSKALETEPGNLQTLYNLGIASRRNKDYTRAQSAFEEILSKNYLPAAANDLGLIFYDTGRYAEAIKTFETLIKKDPSYASAYYNLGLVYTKVDTVSAIKYFTLYKNMITDESEKNEVRKIISNLGKGHR